MTNYLSGLYGPDAPGYIAIWESLNKSTLCFSADELGRAEAHMQALSLQTNAYHSWGLLKAPPAGNSRGRSEDAIAVPGLMSDVDLRSPDAKVHAKNEFLFHDLEEVFAFCAEIGLPLPTQIRHSGNGLYCDWLFPELLVFESDHDRQQYQQLSSAFQRSFGGLAKSLHGRHIDSTGDLVRLTRMPGTKNHKTSPPKEVRLLPDGSGERFTVSDMKEIVKELEARFRSETKPAVQAAESRRRRRRGKKPKTDGGSMPNLDSVLEGCGFAAHCMEQAAGLPEPDWYGFAGIAFAARMAGKSSTSSLGRIRVTASTRPRRSSTMQKKPPIRGFAARSRATSASKVARDVRFGDGSAARSSWVTPIRIWFASSARTSSMWPR